MRVFSEYFPEANGSSWGQGWSTGVNGTGTVTVQSNDGHLDFSRVAGVTGQCYANRPTSDLSGNLPLFLSGQFTYTSSTSGGVASHNYAWAFTDAAGTGYLLYFDFGADTVSLRRWDAGFASTTLTSTALTVTTGTVVTWEVQHTVDGTINAWAWTSGARPSSPTLTSTGNKTYVTGQLSLSAQNSSIDGNDVVDVGYLFADNMAGQVNPAAPGPWYFGPTAQWPDFVLPTDESIPAARVNRMLVVPALRPRRPAAATWTTTPELRSTEPPPPPDGRAVSRQITVVEASAPRRYPAPALVAWRAPSREPLLDRFTNRAVVIGQPRRLQPVSTIVFRTAPRTPLVPRVMPRALVVPALPRAKPGRGTLTTVISNVPGDRWQSRALLVAAAPRFVPAVTVRVVTVVTTTTTTTPRHVIRTVIVPAAARRRPGSAVTWHKRDTVVPPVAWRPLTVRQPIPAVRPNKPGTASIRRQPDLRALPPRWRPLTPLQAPAVRPHRPGTATTWKLRDTVVIPPRWRLYPVPIHPNIRPARPRPAWAWRHHDTIPPPAPADLRDLGRSNVAVLATSTVAELEAPVDLAALITLTLGTGSVTRSTGGHALNTRWTVGDTLVFSYSRINAAGSAANPDAMTVTVTDPWGTETVYTMPHASIVNDSTGHYHINVSATKRGRYKVTWDSDITGEPSDVTTRSALVHPA